jgi:hypothetical protein
MHSGYHQKGSKMKPTPTYHIFYEAALKAIELTGDAYKNLSWFGRNKRRKEGEN